MMADGGEVEPKIYEINDGFHLYYFYGDNKAQVLKYFKMAYDTNKYEQNISIRIMTGSRLKHLEESEEYNYIEDARVVDNINEGGEMAHGGGVPYKPYGKTKGRFKLTYEVEGEPQSEIRESLEEATDSARRYVNPKLGYTNVHIYDESGKEYFFADGGRVDFNEKMAKMRSAYENLEMQVKGKIASAVGIDEAIRIMENDYEIHPFDFITRAVRSGLLGLDEINRDLVFSALMEAENITEEYRDSGQGIGSSDMTYFTKDELDSAGYKTGFINNRLERVDEEGNKLEIDKYNMNF
jgi:hypothetical protein